MGFNTDCYGDSCFHHPSIEEGVPRERYVRFPSGEPLSLKFYVSTADLYISPAAERQADGSWNHYFETLCDAWEFARRAKPCD